MAKTIPPVKLNDVLEAKVTDIRPNGMGIVWVTETYPLYLADVIPGELVRLVVTQVDKLSGYARVVDWLQTSPYRDNQARQYLIEAGTAPLVNWKYSAQLNFKQAQVENAFAQQGLSVTATPTVRTPQPTYYRNKTIVPVKWQDGQLMSGFYRRGSHELVAMDDYYVNDKRLDDVIIIVRDVLARYRVSAFDPDQGQGAIRYIMVRRGYHSHELMVVLVSNVAYFDDQDEVVAAIVAAVPDLTSLILNLSPKAEYVLLSPQNQTLWGQAAIHDTLLGYDFLIGPNSFYQVNPVMTEKLYQLAAEVAELGPDQLVVDAYSGIGTIGISVASRVKQVLGVEVVPGAVVDAQLNLANNGIQNAEYILADAPEQFLKWQALGIKPDVVFVDPPRRGLTPVLIEATVNMQPRRVVYVSCNPYTAARDCALFEKLGYQIARPVIPVDQFPQTAHVEVITVLDRAVD